VLSILRLRNLWITSLITAKPTHRPAPSLTVAQSRMLRLAPDGLIVTVLGLVGGALGGTSRVADSSAAGVCCFFHTASHASRLRSNASVLQALAAKARCRSDSSCTSQRYI
jgi:hypothetical protein